MARHDPSFRLMQIAIFMAQTDTSDFARAHPDDGQKFAALLRAVRPDWTFDIHRVAFGEFPDTIQADAGLITGSIASVHDDALWIRRLEDIVRDFHAERRPLFGACFGHQVIATALGGTVSDNPDGWSFGLVEQMRADSPAWMDPARTLTYLHSAHSQQVTHLPEEAIVLSTSPSTPVAAMALGDHIASTQYHPEMSREFMHGLVPLLRGTVPDPLLDAALAETRPADNPLYARWMTNFFEAAHQ